MNIHQMGSVLAFGDAVTNQIVEIDRRLSAWGFDSHIFGANVDAAPGDKARPDAAYEPFLDNPRDLLIYHYSAYCDNHELFLRSRNRKVVIYHNITPAEFFQPYDATYEALCRRGRAILPRLSGCDLALGVSEYNRQELVQAGFAAGRTGVLPLFLGIDDLEGTLANHALYERLKAGGTTNILFVGKVAPNKAFEDLIKIWAAYQHGVNANSRLILVGARFLPRYDRVLDRLVRQLGLEGRVIWTHRVPLADLVAYYQAADLFVCASKHEGFCAPLLEAMYFGLPILARDTTGVPYTLGPAGVRFHRLAYPALAEVMHLLVEDRALRRQVIETQKRRLQDFSPALVENRLGEILRSMGISLPGREPVVASPGEEPCESTR